MKGIFLIILSLIGFAVSSYLYHSKKHNKKIYCMIGKDCDEVVKSRYGTTFGIENTLGGMLYYSIIFIYGAAIVLNRNLFIDNLVYHSIVIASIGSVLFSVYLAGVQAFVLKKWCEYCIISAIVSVSILIVLVLVL